MRTALLILLCPVLCLAQDRFVEGTVYDAKTNVIGWFRQTVTNKTEAQSFCAKMTNATSLFPGARVSARMHVCQHKGDGKQMPPCKWDLLLGKSMAEITTANPRTNTIAIVRQKPVTNDLWQIEATLPQFRVATTKAAAPAIISKICTEEFAGKQVITNVTSGVTDTK